MSELANRIIAWSREDSMPPPPRVVHKNGHAHLAQSGARALGITVGATGCYRFTAVGPGANPSEPVAATRLEIQHVDKLS